MFKMPIVEINWAQHKGTSLAEERMKERERAISISLWCVANIQKGSFSMFRFISSYETSVMAPEGVILRRLAVSPR